MFSKRFLLVGLAAFGLIFSSVACDDSDGLVENMKDVSTGGQEALEELDNWVPPTPKAPPTDEEIGEALDVALDVADNVLADVEEGAKLYADDAALTVCVVGCDSMYGPLAPVFSDTEVFDACVENCSK